MSKDNRRLKISFNSPVVLTFAILMFVATLLGMASNYSITRALFSTSRSGLLNIMTYVRLFTHVIGHWSFQHFISNVSVLLLLGPMLEEKYGGGVLVEVILITAVITGVINNVLFPFSCLAGASGVVFAFIILASFTEFKKGFRSLLSLLHYSISAIRYGMVLPLGIIYLICLILLEVSAVHGADICLI